MHAVGYWINFANTTSYMADLELKSTPAAGRITRASVKAAETGDSPISRENLAGDMASEKILVAISVIQADMHTVKIDVGSLKTDLSTIKDDFVTLKQDIIRDIDDRLAKFQEESSKKIDTLEGKVTFMQNKISDLEDKTNRLESNASEGIDKQKLFNVVMKGIPVQDDEENLNVYIESIFDSIDIGSVNIRGVVRVKNGRDPKPVIVTLSSIDDCRNVLKSKHKLKSTEYNKMFIEPDQPKHERMTYNVMRLVAKHSDNLEFRKGRLYEKKSTISHQDE